MQSNHRLQKILEINQPDLNILDIHWEAEKSDDHSVLFYKIGLGIDHENKFRERISKAKFAWLIVNRPIENLPHCSQIIVELHWPEIQQKIMDVLYPIPHLKMIGITGTNGKTTTTDLILQLGHQIGKCGLSIGTLGVRTYGKTIEDFGLTSPSFIDLRKYLNKFGQDKDFCVMEVSSHALVQERFFGLTFDAAGWLSFSQDHLDYHKTLDEYFKSKCLILNYLKSDAFLFVPAEQEKLYQDVSQVSQKVKKALMTDLELPLFFKTQFNKNNLEVALTVIEVVFGQKLSIDLNKLNPPDGRFYIKKFKDSFIVVDFAHTPDALENISQGLKSAFPGFKLKVLFGCGGDRDRTKRPLMGQIVDKYADEIYVTSDNPRSENPEQIIEDIIKGIKNKSYKKIINRPEAVKIAFSELESNQVLLLAGKGHENYILINGVKHPYSDIEEVEAFINRKNT
jgi:UDP-N-acetylmuramoyl-L-alanyl-D-glutamate--2,6-diaminopimelate ligase